MIIPATQGCPQGTDLALETALSTIGSASRQDLQSTLGLVDTELNKLFSDRNAILADGGLITFSGTTLTFTEPLLLILNSNALTPGNANNPPITISLGSSSRVFSNGDMWYVVINRTTGLTTTNTIISAATGLPTVNATNNEIFLIAKRSDSADGTPTVYFRNGSCLISGDSVRLGRSGGGAGGLAEEVALSSGSGTTSATISFPSAQGSNTYTVIAQFVNTSDTNPEFQPITITNKTVNGFTATWNMPLPSNNYLIDYTLSGSGTSSQQGEFTIPQGNSSVVVNLPIPVSVATYVVNCEMVNYTDTNPQFQPITVTAKSTTTFTVKWNMPTDTANYLLAFHTASYT